MNRLRKLFRHKPTLITIKQPVDLVESDDDDVTEVSECSTLKSISVIVDDCVDSDAASLEVLENLIYELVSLASDETTPTNALILSLSDGGADTLPQDDVKTRIDDSDDLRASSNIELDKVHDLSVFKRRKTASTTTTMPRTSTQDDSVIYEKTSFAHSDEVDSFMEADFESPVHVHDAQKKPRKSILRPSKGKQELKSPSLVRLAVTSKPSRKNIGDKLEVKEAKMKRASGDVSHLFRKGSIHLRDEEKPLKKSTFLIENNDEKSKIRKNLQEVELDKRPERPQRLVSDEPKLTTNVAPPVSNRTTNNELLHGQMKQSSVKENTEKSVEQELSLKEDTSEYVTAKSQPSITHSQDVRRKIWRDMLRPSDQFLADILADEMTMEDDVDSLDDDSVSVPVAQTRAYRKILSRGRYQRERGIAFNLSQLSLGTLLRRVPHTRKLTGFEYKIIKANDPVTVFRRMLNLHLDSARTEQLSLTDEYLTKFKVKRPFYDCCSKRSVMVPVNERSAQLLLRDIFQGIVVRKLQRELEDPMKCMVPLNKQGRSHRKWHQYVWVSLKNLFKYERRDETIQLKSYEFIAMLFFHEVNIICQLRDLHLIVKFGPVPAFFLRFLGICLLDAPMMMFILTLASYARFCYLKFFAAMPLLKGMSFVMFILYVFIEARRASILFASLRLSVHMLQPQHPWPQCIQSTKFNESCIPLGTNVTHNDFCPRKHHRWTGYESYATEHITRYVMYKNDYVHEQSLEGILYYVIGAITWFLVLFLGLIGFRRLHRLLIRMQILLFVPVLLFCAYIISQRGRSTKAEYKFYSLDLFRNIEFSLSSLTFGSKFERIPFLIWVSTMKPMEMEPQECVVTVMLLHVIWLVIIFMTTQTCIFSTIEKYNINADCFHSSQYALLYALVPDFMTNVPFGSVFAFIWIAILTLYVGLKAVYSFHTITDTCCNVQPFFRRHLFLLVVGQCVICTGFVFVHLSRTIDAFLERFLEVEIQHTVLMAFCMFVIGLEVFFTWSRFNDDYVYSYEVEPWRLWRIWLAIAAYISFFIILFLTIWEVFIYDDINIHSKLLLLIFSMCTLTALSLRLFRGIIYDMRLYSMGPDPSWLPAGENPTRRRFFSVQSNFRMKMGFMVCSHRCLRMSNVYYQMAEHQVILMPSVRDDTFKLAEKLVNYEELN